VNRDQLELVLTREGLTRPQTRAVLDAAEQYATSQAKLAIDSLGGYPPAVTDFVPLHLLDLSKPGTMNACDRPGVNTTKRRDVTCQQCREAP
jgi:hypothetical protein